MKIIYNNYIPSKGYIALNFFGIIFARKEYDPLSGKTINHEAIHTAQMREMFYLFFYLWYLLEWGIRLIQYRNRKKAYRNISFEREAYDNDDDMEYLKKRSVWGWWKYLHEKRGLLL